MNKKGFTLLELLVGVLIIGILAAIALPMYNKSVWKSRFIQAKTLAKNIANAEEIFYMTNDRYTRDISELDIDTPPYNKLFAYSGETTYYYDWGECSLNYTSDRAAVFCSVNRKAQNYISYRISNANTSYKTNQKICIASGLDRKPTENELNYKICQEETQSTANGWGTTSLYWVYK